MGNNMTQPCVYVRVIQLRLNHNIEFYNLICTKSPHVPLLRMEKEQVALWFPFGKSGLNLQITLVSH